MKLADYPEKFINELTVDQIHKLFPDNFYTKYAPHLRLLEFEKKLIRDNKEQPRLKFKKHKVSVSDHQAKKIKISSFDRVDDLIHKNYEQFHRMSQYTKELGYKLEAKPPKAIGQIRTTRQNFVMPNPETFDKVKLLQDLAYERRIQQLKKKKQHSQQVLKFKKTQKLQKFNSNIHKNFSTLKYTKSQFFQSPQQNTRFAQASKNVLHLIQKSKKINEQLKQLNLPAQKKHLSMILNFNHSLKQLNKYQKIWGNKLSTGFKEIPKNMHNASMLLTRRSTVQKKARDLLYETEQLKKKSASLNIQKRKDQKRYQQNLKKFIDSVQQNT